MSRKEGGGIAAVSAVTVIATRRSDLDGESAAGKGWQGNNGGCGREMNEWWGWL